MPPSRSNVRVPHPPVLLSPEYVEAREVLQRRARRRRPWLDVAKTPFRDDTPRVGAHKTAAADFEMSRLRRCAFDLDSIVWEARVGGGADGYVWKVRFGTERPSALKVVCEVAIRFPGPIPERNRPRS